MLAAGIMADGRCCNGGCWPAGCSLSTRCPLPACRQRRVLGPGRRFTSPHHCHDLAASSPRAVARPIALVGHARLGRFRHRGRVVANVAPNHRRGPTKARRTAPRPSRLTQPVLLQPFRSSCLLALALSHLRFSHTHLISLASQLP